MFEKELENKFIDTVGFLKKIPLGLDVYKQLSVIRNYFSMSQSQLANRTGIKQPIIAKIEKGDQNISIDYLKKIANGLECDVQITLTPKKKLNIIKENQIKRFAKTIVQATLNNSALEQQFLSKKEQEELLNSVVTDLKMNPKGIWDV